MLFQNLQRLRLVGALWYTHFVSCQITFCANPPFTFHQTLVDIFSPILFLNLFVSVDLHLFRNVCG